MGQALDISADNEDAEAEKNHYGLVVPNRIYTSLGRRSAFTEVLRTSHPEPARADFIVSGEYAVVSHVNHSVGSVLLAGGVLGRHSIYFKGTAHVRVTEAKTGDQIFEKTYTEELTDAGRNNTALQINEIGPAFIEPISADIKKAIYQKLGKKS